MGCAIFVNNSDDLRLLTVCFKGKFYDNTEAVKLYGVMASVLLSLLYRTLSLFKDGNYLSFLERSQKLLPVPCATILIVGRATAPVQDCEA